MRTEVSRTLETFYDGQATTPEVKCYDDILEQTYKDEMRFMAQTAVSTLLAFLITVIGVFCLTLFETEYRRKEIAIRRVMGSSVSEVLSLFAMRYAVPLIIAFLIAAPHWLRHQPAVAAAICSTRPHSFVDIPPGFRHRQHSRSPHRHRTMLAGGNDESRGKHPDGIVHSPLTDGPPHTFP